MIDTRTAILLALRRGPSYGLGLIDRVYVATDRRILLQQGRVYPVLGALQADGLITTCEADAATTAGRPRAYWRLTAAGRLVARSEARSLANLLR